MWVRRAVGAVAVALLVAGVGAVPASSAGATGEASNKEDRPFAVGQRAVTFVDTSRPTPAGNGEAAASTRTIETLVLYPARGKSGGTAVSEAPPARGRRFPVVVFLHGSGTTGEDYREALERWAAGGYVVAAPTAPLGGHGVLGGEALASDRSNHPDDVRFVLDELAHELPRALRRITDLDRVAIIGKSLGAATAMQVAFDPSHADDRIRAVVPIAEPPAVEGSEWVDLNLASGNRVPVLLVHGDADEQFAYDGSRSEFRDGPRAEVSPHAGSAPAMRRRCRSMASVPPTTRSSSARSTSSTAISGPTSTPSLACARTPTFPASRVLEASRRG